MQIFDTNHSVTPKLAAIKALGVTCVIRYLATADKSITQAEARAIAAAGIKLALVYEAYGDTQKEVMNAVLGASHARDTLAKAPGVGTPDGAGMYYAVDKDESTASIQSRIVPYFKAVRDTLKGRYRIGVYGSGAVCQAILDAGLAELTWISCSSGWSGYASFKATGRWNILQHLPTKTVIPGFDLDPDEINPARPDIGAFTPFSAIVNPPPPSPPPEPVTLAKLQSALHLEVGPIDTIEKLVQVALAVRSFQRMNGLSIDGVPGGQTQRAIA